MNKFLPLAAIAFTLTVTSCIKDRIFPVTPPPVVTGRDLIHYWNFNGDTLLKPTQSIGNASVEIGGLYDAVNPGSLLNAHFSDDTGNALRVRNPSTNLILHIPTTGYKTPVITYAVMRTSSGAQQNEITYTTDGTTYINDHIDPASVTVTESWIMYSIDFHDVPASADNPNFALEITFSNGNTGTSGNDRFDNISIEAEKK